MAKTMSIDTPLAEINLRRYERPYNLPKRELVRKLCLTLGLLNPGDSRDVIVDVLYVLLQAKKSQKLLSNEEIRERVIEFRKDEGLDEQGCAASNLRRQVRRLRQVFLIEKIKTDYRVSEFMPLSETFSEKVEQYLIPNILSRVNEYLDAVDACF